MELEQSELEEEVVEEKKGKNLPEELAEPHPAAETSEDAEQVTKTVSFLPRNKEELECLIKHIQDTVTVNILPKLHRCIVAKVRSCHWKGVLQACAVTIKVGESQRKRSMWKKKRPNWRETMWKHKRGFIPFVSWRLLTDPLASVGVVSLLLCWELAWTTQLKWFTSCSLLKSFQPLASTQLSFCIEKCRDSSQLSSSCLAFFL